MSFATASRDTNTQPSPWPRSTTGYGQSLPDYSDHAYPPSGYSNMPYSGNSGYQMPNTYIPPSMLSHYPGQQQPNHTPTPYSNSQGYHGPPHPFSRFQSAPQTFKSTGNTMNPFSGNPYVPQQPPHWQQPSHPFPRSPWQPSQVTQTRPSIIPGAFPGTEYQYSDPEMSSAYPSNNTGYYTQGNPNTQARYHPSDYVSDSQFANGVPPHIRAMSLAASSPHPSGPWTNRGTGTAPSTLFDKLSATDRRNATMNALLQCNGNNYQGWMTDYASRTADNRDEFTACMNFMASNPQPRTMTSPRTAQSPAPQSLFNSLTQADRKSCIDSLLYMSHENRYLPAWMEPRSHAASLNPREFEECMTHFGKYLTEEQGNQLVRSIQEAVRSTAQGSVSGVYPNGTAQAATPPNERTQTGGAHDVNDCMV